MPQKGEGVRRKRSGMTTQKKQQIKMSKKSAGKKAARRRPKVHQICPSSVYVGNLMPTVTESVLQRLFLPCGKIDTVQIRCSQGRGVVVGKPLKEYFSTDRLYATVTFSTPFAAKKALKFNRCILHQVQIVVSLNAGDLPEVRFITNERLAIIRAPYDITGRSNALQATELNVDNAGQDYIPPARFAEQVQQEAVRHQPEQKTPYVPAVTPHTPKPIARNVVMGISLYATVM